MKPESEKLAVKNVVLGARGVKGKRTCVYSHPHAQVGF